MRCLAEGMLNWLGEAACEHPGSQHLPHNRFPRQGAWRRLCPNAEGSGVCTGLKQEQASPRMQPSRSRVMSAPGRQGEEGTADFLNPGCRWGCVCCQRHICGGRRIGISHVRPVTVAHQHDDQTVNRAEFAAMICVVRSTNNAHNYHPNGQLTLLD